MAESVVVGVRVRPFNDREKNLDARLCIEMNGPTTIIRDLSKKDAEEVVKDFTFDESFWSHDGFEDNGTGYMKALPGTKYADQRQVYDVFGERVLKNAWEGFHCCLFAYGQTGAGKSYSMVGYGANKGIVPISCEEIFKRIATTDAAIKRFEVTVSMVEIYNEAVQDLLILPEDRPKKGLEIRESKLLGIYIDGVTKRPVDSYAAIEETIEEATNHRTIGSTLMNATSSRAHTVQAIEFKQIEKVGGSDQVKVSMINLVDLAGSEKAGQTGASGDRLKEGAAINKSLSALGNVIEKLAEKSSGKKNIIIPYRDSKLTRLLQNALGGSSKTIMICALSPASSNYEETLSTLRYADRAKKIKNVAVVNENPQEKLLRELRDENSKLKELMQQMQNGEAPDMKVMKEMQEKQQEMADAQAALDEMAKSFEQRLAEAKTVHDKTVERERNKRRASMGREVILAANHTPMLVNLNADPQLTCRIRYNLEEGKFLRVGTFHGHEAMSSDSEDEESDEEEEEPEIMLHHSSVFHHHAKLQNLEGVVRIFSTGEAAEHTFINGQTASERLEKQKEEKAANDGGLMGMFFGRRGSSESAPEDTGKDGKPVVPAEDDGVLLSHGDRIIFGECCFFYCDPRQGVPEVMVASKEVDYTKAVGELSKVSSKWLTAGNKIRALQSLGVTSFKEQVEDLEEQVRALKEDGARHQQELSERDALLESAVVQAEEAAKANAGMTQSSAEKNDEIARLKKEVQSLAAAKIELERVHEEVGVRIGDMEIARNDAAKAGEEKDAIIGRLREEVSSLQESKADADKSLSDELQKAKGEVASKIEALELLRLETDKANDKIKELEASNNDYTKAHEEKDTIIEKLQEETRGLQESKADVDKSLFEELQRAKDEVASKSEELQLLRLDAEKASAQVGDLEKSRNEATKANEENDAIIKQLQEQSRSLEVAKADADNSISNELQRVKDDAASKIDALELMRVEIEKKAASQMEEVEATKRELERTRTELESSKADVEKASAEKDVTIGRLQEEVQALQSGGGEDKNRMIDQLQAQIVTLQERLRESEKKRSSNPECTPPPPSYSSTDESRQQSLTQSISVSFQEAVKALDLVETSLTDLVSRRDQSRKAAEYPMF